MFFYNNVTTANSAFSHNCDKRSPPKVDKQKSPSKIFLVQWTPDLVDFKGPEKFVSYCRSLLLTISYNKKIKRKYFQGTFLFVYYWRSSLIAVVAKCRVHCTWINSKSVSKSQSQKLQVKRTLKQNNATIMINFMNFTN